MARASSYGSGERNYWLAAEGTSRTGRTGASGGVRAAVVIAGVSPRHLHHYWIQQLRCQLFAARNPAYRTRAR